MPAPSPSDVILSGGGLVGQAFAVALAHHGLSVHVIDPVDQNAQAAPGADGRVASIASGSWKMLETIGVAQGISEACPIEQIWVSDGLKPGELDFVPEEGTGPLGFMVENRLMRLALQQAVARHSDLIHLHMPAKAVEIERDAHKTMVTLDTGAVLQAPVLVIAARLPSRNDCFMPSPALRSGEAAAPTAASPTAAIPEPTAAAPDLPAEPKA